MSLITLHESRYNHADHGSAHQNRDAASRSRHRTVRHMRPAAEDRRFKKLVRTPKNQPFPKHDPGRPLKLQLPPPLTPKKSRKQSSRRNPPSRRRIKRHAAVNNGQRNQSQRGSHRRCDANHIQRQ